MGWEHAVQFDCEVLSVKIGTCVPRPLARSLVDSVFPVPAGPRGFAPSFKSRAPVIVIQHRSVSGVMTRRVAAP